MVLTITLNPLLERRFLYDKIKPGEVNRTNNQVFKAGGKGINVSRQLNYLQIKNLAFTFLGGNSGKILKQILTEEGIDYTFIPTKNETRSAALILEEESNRITSFFGPNTELCDREVEEFSGKLEKMINNCTTVVFSGSAPSAIANSIFPYGIELANKLDKFSVLDTYGDHLKTCIERGPSVVHINLKEAENSLGLTLSTEEQKIEFLNYLYGSNVKMGFLTDGANPFYASKFDFHYKITPHVVKELDATGSGDAFTAGVVFGLEKVQVFEEFVAAATAMGAVNASRWNVCDVSLEETIKISEKVQVSPVGKKMKIIDDLPIN